MTLDDLPKGAVVALTGHRPDKLGGYVSGGPVESHVRSRVRNAFRVLQPSQVITGMAQGFDQWGADEAIKLRIPVRAAIPFEGQERIWPAPARREYDRILSHCFDLYAVCPPPAAAFKFLARNKWMVDNAEIVIACWDGSSGGTAHCYRYAKEQRRRVVRLDPSDAIAEWCGFG